MFAEVPVLPTVVPLGAIVLAGLLWHLRRRDLLSGPRVAVALALCGYAGGVVANTVFPIFLDKPPLVAPWSAFVNTTPIAGYEVGDAVMNVCVFVPVGMLMLLVAPALSWSRAVLVGAALSLAIETSQYAAAHLLGGGHVADVNDLLFNVVGAGLGAGLLVTLAGVPGTAALVDRFRWTDPGGSASYAPSAPAIRA
jgi:hypothetical protein